MSIYELMARDISLFWLKLAGAGIPEQLCIEIVRDFAHQLFLSQNMGNELEHDESDGGE